MDSNKRKLVDDVPPELLAIIISFLDCVEHLLIIPKVCTLFHDIFWSDKKHVYENLLSMKERMEKHCVGHVLWIDHFASHTMKSPPHLSYIREECLNFLQNNGSYDNELSIRHLNQVVSNASSIKITYNAQGGSLCDKQHIFKSEPRLLTCSSKGYYRQFENMVDFKKDNGLGSENFLNRLSNWVNSWFTISFEMDDPETEVDHIGNGLGSEKCSGKFTAKVIILGENKIGISSLMNYLQTYVYYFRNSNRSTVHYVKQRVDISDSVYCELYLLDSQGNDAFSFCGCCVNTDCAIVCFALNDMNSFSRISYWISLARSQLPGCELLLVGLKADLVDEREVSDLMARMIAKSLGVPYLETSSVTGLNINTVFTYLAHICFCKTILE